ERARVRRPDSACVWRRRPRLSEHSPAWPQAAPASPVDADPFEESAMRKFMLPLLLATAGAIGMAAAPAAEAYDSGRIYVGIGDVVFSYGRPYYRHNHEPLYVVYERGYPRYYRMPA